MSFQTTGCSPTGNVGLVHILEKGNAIVLVTAEAPDQDRQYRAGDENDPAFWLLMKQLFCKQKENPSYGCDHSGVKAFGQKCQGEE